MDYSHIGRRGFYDLNSTFNERASPRSSSLLSNSHGLFDMNQFPRNRIFQLNVDNGSSFHVSDRTQTSNFNRYVDEISKATLIPVVHLQSGSSSDNTLSSQKSTGFSDSNRSSSSSTKKSSEAEVDELTNILINTMTDIGKQNTRNVKSICSFTTQPYCNRKFSNSTIISSQQSKATIQTKPLVRQTSTSGNGCFRCHKLFESPSDSPTNHKTLSLHINGPLNTFFHKDCFSCYRCNTNLDTDSFFYAQKRLLCSRCIHESLEKCTVCDFVINDRVIRVLGQPYHPKCFTCSICNNCLDGKAFTVDVHERMFCLEDFHKRYAPKCGVCGQPICPQDGDHENKRIISANKSFHLACFGVHDK